MRRARQSWLSVLAQLAQRRSSVQAHLGQWSVLRRGLRLLQKLLRDVEPLLPPAGPALCTLQQLRSGTDHYQVGLISLSQPVKGIAQDF